MKKRIFVLLAVTMLLAASVFVAASQQQEMETAPGMRGQGVMGGGMGMMCPMMGTGGMMGGEMMGGMGGDPKMMGRMMEMRGEMMMKMGEMMMKHGKQLQKGEMK